MSHSLVSLAAEDAVDLHLHTRYSDGKWLPRDLFAALAQGGLRLVSVVDHDQLAHLPEVMTLGAASGIAVIAGTEVTAEWRGLPAHMLCYAPLATGFVGDALARLMAETDARMRANTRQVYDTFTVRGYSFPRQAATLADLGGEPIRALDVAALLLAHGYAESPGDALRMVTEAGYRQARAPMGDAVAAAHAGGALCLIAHPGRGEGEIHHYAPEEIEALLDDGIPLDGVEVYYPSHTPAQVAAYAAMARRRGLLVSAGSDSHGPHQRMPVAYPAGLIAPATGAIGGRGSLSQGRACRIAPHNAGAATSLNRGMWRLLSQRAGLFVPQHFERAHAGGAVGDEGRHQHADERRGRDDANRKLRADAEVELEDIDIEDVVGQRDDQHRHERACEADQPVLHQHTAQDVATGVADRLQDADFAPSFEHRQPHRVRDDDDARDHRQRRDGRQQDDQVVQQGVDGDHQVNHAERLHGGDFVLDVTQHLVRLQWVDLHLVDVELSPLSQFIHH